MEKVKTVLNYTAIGLALYHTVSMLVQMGIITLCQLVYPYAEKVGITKSIVNSFLNTNPVTMRIMLVVIVIAIIGNHKDFIYRFFKFLFDVLIGWAVMMLWRLLAIPVPEFLQGILSDATLSILITSIVTGLIEIELFVRKDNHDNNGK